ncbi:hypothetical protein CRG98_018423 [Punica granatum]|uniref:F-box associated beta-propeller type 3 domain-containing protein n=1 Tax=Punica granatum TaxID=22663 RepID=A0A2I0JY52_PUNGR|nr:hypothetical protein CRG98_018423 [Punica granatum]
MAILSRCFEWLGLVGQLGGSSTDSGRDLFEAVPADVVVAILSRLSIDQILRCRAVHRNNYRGSATSGIMYHSWSRDKEGRELGFLYLYSTILHLEPCHARANGCGGYDGDVGVLLQFTDEEILVPSESTPPNHYVYSIRNLRGTSSRDISTSPYHSRGKISALNLDDILYWMAYWYTPCAFCIIVFKVDSEQLLFMPHPGGACRRIDNHMDMFVVEMDGHLCLAHASSKSLSIWIWVLEDHRSWLWSKRFNVNLGTITWWFPFYECIFLPPHYCLQPLGIQNEELILAVQGMGIIRYHLWHLRVVIIRKEGYPSPMFYAWPVASSSSPMTFTSLRDLLM